MDASSLRRERRRAAKLREEEINWEIERKKEREKKRENEKEKEREREKQRERQKEFEKDERLSQDRIKQQLDKLYIDHKVEAEKVRLIEVDQFAAVKFSSQTTSCLAALDLNGPTVAIVISKKGAIIVSMAPYENFKRLEEIIPGTSLFHATKGMTYLMNL